MSGPLEIAREYFSEWEAIQSSTYRKLLGVSRCLQAMARKCEGRFVVLQVDAANLLGIVNRGSRKLIINELARELFWLGCLRHQVTVTVEWVPREENAFADDISKILIPEDFMLSIEFFLLMDGRWSPHTVDPYSSNANNKCVKFYVLNRCRRAAGINAFGQLSTGENCWINCP